MEMGCQKVHCEDYERGLISLDRYNCKVESGVIKAATRPKLGDPTGIECPGLLRYGRENCKRCRAHLFDLGYYVETTRGLMRGIGCPVCGKHWDQRIE